MNVFEDIYSHNGWGFGSGHGSLPSVTRGYRKFIETFLEENNIQSVVDYGCGDWQFSKLIKWGDARYAGVDVVPSLIEENTQRYSSGTISFRTIDPRSSKLPKADLLITKDVLQHLPNVDIDHFLKKIAPRFKFVLITNCVVPKEDLNIDIEAGGFRPLDVRLKPFNQKGVVVYSFVGPKSLSIQKRKFFPSWKKHVLLIDNR